MTKRAIFLAFSCFLLATCASAQTARQVSAEPFSRVAQSRVLQFPASVVNLQLADVAAETSGRILQFPVEVGDEVSSGQKLLEINCKTAVINQNRVKAGLKRLKAQRLLTRQQLERAKRLSSSSSISREELDQRQTQLDADNASIEEQQNLLQAATQSVEDCQVNAPFAGTIIEKMSSIGAYAQPGSPVVRLLKQDAVEVELDISTALLPQLKQSSRMTFEANGQSYPLKLRKILPSINTANFQQRSRLSFIDAEKPVGGTLGLVRFETRRNFLPARYIQQRKSEFGVFIVNDNRARFVVLPNAEEGQSAAAELAPDNRVITSHLQLLSDQDEIAVTP